MKILLVNPNFNPPATSRPGHSSPKAAARWSPFQAVMAPLGLATVAALTPEDIQVDIWDEAIDGIIGPDADFKHEYALVGVTGYINHAGRVKELGEFFRRRGWLTAAGGPGVSSEPELYRDSFDILFVGEAEYTWPRFVAEWRAGRQQALYRQVGKVDLAHTPPPRWEGVSLNSYGMAAVQTTRGCPFDCEFCDVIYIFGRQARHKTIERVLEEVRAIERRGARRILFCDDNFIGNPRYAKDLVRALLPLNRSFRWPLAFFAQLTLNVAKDDEMLALMADANFPGVFIGIESPNRDSLIETNKPQNYQADMVAAVKKIHGYGIVVQSGMIVGFDHDDAAIFDQHFEFLQETGLPVPMVNVLKAPKGTRLWERLLKEGRVIQAPELRRTTNVEAMSNVLPKRMTLAQLLSGYLALVERVRDWRNFEARVRTLIAQVKRRPDLRRRGHWKEFLRFPVLLASMDGPARWTTLRLLVHVLRRAPFMAESVIGVVAYQYLEALRLPALTESIGEQIRFLTENERSLQREQPAFLIPPEFRKSFKAVFPELHERMRLGLADPARTQGALVQVACDFLARWGSGFERFENHHRQFLFELCDRAIAAENRWGAAHASASIRTPESSQGFGRPGLEPAILPAAGSGAAASARRGRPAPPYGLSDDVLRCVEQDLRSL